MSEDKELALNLSESLFFDKKYGATRVKKELEKKMIASNIIEEVIAKLDLCYEEKHIKYIINAKYGRRIFIDAEKCKITKSLMKYGYPEEKIKLVLECLEKVDY